MNDKNWMWVCLAIFAMNVGLSGGSRIMMFRSDPFVIEQAKAAAPIALANMVPNSTPDEPEPFECQCNGTGRSGDGLGPCGCENCDCKRTEAVATNPHQAEIIYDFTATWCGPCQVQHRIDEKLKAAGWGIGTEGRHIRHVDIDTPEGRRLYDSFGCTSIPTHVAVRDGKAVRRLVGVATDWDYWWLWSGEGKDRQQSTMAPSVWEQQNARNHRTPAANARR